MPKYDEASIGVSRINEYLKSKEQLQRRRRRQQGQQQRPRASGGPPDEK
jgi:hypothetical protein